MKRTTLMGAALLATGMLFACGGGDAEGTESSEEHSEESSEHDEGETHEDEEGEHEEG